MSDYIAPPTGFGCVMLGLLLLPACLGGLLSYLMFQNLLATLFGVVFGVVVEILYVWKENRKFG